MGAPHNPARYGEKWPQDRIDATLYELEPLRTHLTLSGGWAWHFMSPEGHPEYKHAHDHKDVDFFVHPSDVAQMRENLSAHAFYRVSTRYDGPDKSFQRFEKAAISSPDRARFKITLDMFVRNVPFRVVRGQWRVVEPEYLLGLYESVHSSSECFAVLAARNLLAQGRDPVGSSKLVEIPIYPK